MPGGPESARLGADREQEHPISPAQTTGAHAAGTRAADGQAAGAQVGQRIAPEGKPAPRNGYLDLLRVLAIGAVVTGHWLLTSVAYHGGQLSGESAMSHVSWAGWATLLFQVMPTFFLVGGYAAAISWTRHHNAGATWTMWTRSRAARLLWPTAVYVAFAATAAGLAAAAGISHAEIATIGWALGYQLWFLPVYLMLTALTPVMLAAHRRWGLRVPVAMAIGAAAVDLAFVGLHVTALGRANYFLVWGSMYQWGFAWQDGTLTRSRLRPLALAAGGAATLAALLAAGLFPVDMIGTVQDQSNTTPPSLALLAFAAAQAGLVIAAEPLAARLLANRGRSRLIERLNASVMTVYLWHLVPVLLAGVALYPSGLMPTPATGSAAWWASRPIWLGALAITLVAVVAALNWLHRPLLLLPAGIGPARAWSAILLAGGIAAAMYSLTSTAAHGFAPGGTPSPVILAAFAASLALTLLSGRERETEPPPPAA